MHLKLRPHYTITESHTSTLAILNHICEHEFTIAQYLENLDDVWKLRQCNIHRDEKKMKVGNSCSRRQRISTTAAKAIWTWQFTHGTICMHTRIGFACQSEWKSSQKADAVNLYGSIFIRYLDQSDKRKNFYYKPSTLAISVRPVKPRREDMPRRQPRPPTTPRYYWHQTASYRRPNFRRKCRHLWNGARRRMPTVDDDILRLTCRTCVKTIATQSTTTDGADNRTV